MSAAATVNPTPKVRDLPGMKSSITFADEFTPISKPPMIPHDKVTLETHSNVYHPSQLHTGHHRKPSPSPDHSSIKEVVVHNEKEPVTVFMHQRRPSASPDPCQLKGIVQSSSPVTSERIAPHRKPSPSSIHSTSNVIAHNSSVQTSQPLHKKPSSSIDHSSMKSVVTQAPIENSTRRIRASPGGTDHIILG